WLRAYGDRRVEPERAPMTVDTVFDLASLTKPVATATSVMLLVETGQVRLRDRVSAHLPEFTGNGKERITVIDLLLHRGGLIPDNALADYDHGPEEAWRRICALELEAAPGETFSYTDVGFIVLGELVRRVSGEPLDAFARRRVFAPLGMHDTGFLPDEARRRRAAPTEQREGRWLQGEVHDPRAARLGGAAGHAGLFGTAADLAVFASMLLDEGRHGDGHVLAARTVATMTAGYAVPGGERGLGWDRRSAYSSNRGELMTDRAFGHGGFTGTVLWIDPGLDLFVIFLSNRVHPSGSGLVNPLAGAIGSIAAGAVIDAAAPGTGAAAGGAAGRTVLTGLDVLRRDAFAPVRGLRIGLIANRTAVDRRGVSAVEILHEAAPVELVAVFSPEHGFGADLDRSDIPDGIHAGTGLPVHSLYGESRSPRPEHLVGLDALVFDIQDIGTRFYTYISTMGLAMRAAAAHGLRFIVLDRPNPINGVTVEGPVLDRGRESFTAFHPIAVRHGMTVGELARLFADEVGLDIDLGVVPVEGWRRSDWFDATGLWWVDPSPNMRSLTAALLYPGIGLLEMTNLSVGRGTDRPFERVGAPWIDASALAAEMNGAGLEGVRFVPTAFTPTASLYAGTTCGGLEIVVTDRDRVKAVRVGLTLATALRRLHRDAWDVSALDRLLAHRATADALLSGAPVAAVETGHAAALESFLERRRRVLLYP
ncbi:MAG: exo-beta-N-acetylmuramidase NamZ domain-containing protein, partial [Planctomycetota bacterium]